MISLDPQEHLGRLNIRTTFFPNTIKTHTHTHTHTHIYVLMAATCDPLLQRVVAPTVGAHDEAVAVHVVVVAAAAIGANR